MGTSAQLTMCSLITFGSSSRFRNTGRARSPRPVFRNLPWLTIAPPSVAARGDGGSETALSSEDADMTAPTGSTAAL